MLRYLFFSAALCMSAAAYSQDGRAWTLDECIRYAVENSIDVKKQTLSTDKSRIDLADGKWAFVPSLSFSTDYTLSTGRVLDPTTYQFVETSLTGNNSSSFSSGIVLFEGGRKTRVLDRAKRSLRAAYLQEESVKYNLKLNVIAAYFDVICAVEQIKIAEQSSELINSRLERTNALLEAGNITESDVLQLKSKLISAQNDITSARQSELMAKLTLCDLLEIEDYVSFSVAEPDSVNVFPRMDIEEAVMNSPDYQVSLSARSVAESDLRIAKAAYSPTLSLSAGYGSSFSDARKKAIQNPDGTVSYQSYPFFQQYIDNSSAYVSLNLKIPILNALSARHKVARAKIAVSEAEYAVLDAHKRIRKKILQAEIDCRAADDKFCQAGEELVYTEEALRQIDEKYNMNTTDYLSWQTAMAEYVSAQYAMVEARYTLILKREILRTYYDGL